MCTFYYELHWDVNYITNVIKIVHIYAWSLWTTNMKFNFNFNLKCENMKFGLDIQKQMRRVNKLIDFPFTSTTFMCLCPLLRNSIWINKELFYYFNTQHLVDAWTKISPFDPRVLMVIVKKLKMNFRSFSLNILCIFWFWVIKLSYVLHN
jgi:hypothetical protein